MTIRHFEAMALIILASSLIMALSYATEWFSGWYGGDKPSAARSSLPSPGPTRRLFGCSFCAIASCPADSLVADNARGALWRLCGGVDGNLVGMWLERILIIWNTLSHGYLPSMRHVFFPTVWRLVAADCAPRASSR